MPGELITYLSDATVHRPPFLGGVQWQLSNLGPITVLFGRNGSGKSLLLRNWRDGLNTSGHYVVPERSGDLDFDPNQLRLQMDPAQRRNSTQGNYATEYRRQIVARINAYFIARGNTRSGQLPGDPAKLEELLSILLPDLIITLSGSNNPPYLIQRAQDQSTIHGINELSSGEAQLLTVALDILTIGAIWDIEGKAQRIMLVDEPDAHIHPDLQVRFADFVVQVAKEYRLQFVVATHSTTLLSAIGQFAGTDASVIYLDRRGASFRAQPFTRVLREVSACLGGHALMGPLFGAPLLLVEGDDDYRIWSQVPRHHVASFAAIPCGGDEIQQFQRTLEKVLGSLRDDLLPAGYALLDGDKVLPSPTDVAQSNVKFIRLACHEAENLYLTEQVLASMATTWSAASAQIVSQAQNFGDKAAFLATAGEWDRQNTDIKSVIHEVAQIVDPKKAHWTMRVGKAIGRERPIGDLAAFLGESVVDTLWTQVAA